MTGIDHDQLATGVARALVYAMGLPSWPQVRDRYSAVIGLGEEMDATRAQLADPVGGGPAVAARVDEWRARVLDVLDDIPELAGPLRGALVGTRPRRRRRAVAWTVLGLAAILMAAVTVRIRAIFHPGARTAVTVTVSDARGGTPSADALALTKRIITDRLTEVGYRNPRVRTTRSGFEITVDESGRGDELVELLSPGRAGFRRVLRAVMDTAPAPHAPVGGPAAPDLEALRAKLGTAALTAAEAITDPNATANDAAMMDALAPFAGLGPEEVALLPAAMQYGVPQITCAELARRPAPPEDAAAHPAVACERRGSYKYLLDVATVTGADIADAQAALGTLGNGWQVDITFTAFGQNRWTNATRTAFNNADGACQRRGDEDHCLIAVVLDNTIESMPEVQAVIVGPATISGEYTEREARLLATQLRRGALPLTLTVVSVESRSY